MTRLAVAATVVLLAATAFTIWLFNPPPASVTWHTGDTPVIVPATEPRVAIATLTGSSRSRSATRVTASGDTTGTVPLDINERDDETQVAIDTASFSEGRHTVTVTSSTGDVATVTIVIDRTPPPLDVQMPTRHPIAGETFTVTGQTDANVTITVTGSIADSPTTTAVSGTDGTFTMTFTHRNDTARFTATDAAGNTTVQDVTFTVIPSRVERDEIRALHVSFHAWGDPNRRARIDRLLDAGIVNAIQFDLKDESGHVGHRTNVALANETGAALNLYELADVVAELHDRNIPVIGRIVAFADPIVAPWAFRTGQPELTIQTPSGGLYTGNYKGFTNFTHPTIITYLTELAVEAASVGVDHILWDYLRRPDGRLSQLVIPGLNGPVEDAIVAFTAQADAALHPWRIQHGASLYGIAADRPREIGQDVAKLRHHLDYVAPMIYPSHWGPGEYGVADPNRQPRAIVQATLAVWQNATDGSRARVIPWLEDTNYRAYDRPNHVREQHRGTYAAGINEWLMWDAGSFFTPSAYDVTPPTRG